MTISTVTNGVDLNALQTTVEAVREDRGLGEVTFSLNGTWDKGFRLNASTGTLIQGGVPDESRAGRYELHSDEPEALLGADSAASPGEHLLNALAGCYTVTLVANAASRGIELAGYSLDLEADLDLAAFLGVAADQPLGIKEIRVSISLDAPGVERKELEDLVTAVEALSPIRDTLVRPVAVITQLATN